MVVSRRQRGGEKGTGKKVIRHRNHVFSSLEEREIERSDTTLPTKEDLDRGFPTPVSRTSVNFLPTGGGEETDRDRNLPSINDNTTTRRRRSSNYPLFWGQSFLPVPEPAIGKFESLSSPFLPLFSGSLWFFESRGTRERGRGRDRFGNREGGKVSTGTKGRMDGRNFRLGKKNCRAYFTQLLPDGAPPPLTLSTMAGTIFVRFLERNRSTIESIIQWRGGSKRGRIMGGRGSRG